MENLHLGVLFLLGVGLSGGIMGAWVFQRLRIPQVVGYIVIGFLIGQSGLRLIQNSDIVAFRALNQFALGIIGFLVGGELKAKTMRKHGKQFCMILLGEGLGAFLLVGFCAGAVVYIVASNFAIALAAGIVFGAIASATDPASTMQVLWEYRARGILTTSLIAVVALDDALAMTLYGLGTSVAQILTGGAANIFHELINISVEIFGAVALGMAAGVLLNFIHHRFTQGEKILALAIGTLLLVIGVSISVGMDVILATMAVGVTLTNLAPRKSEELFAVVRNFASPIYVIFFVLVGARLSIGNMPGWLWLIVGLYICGRTAGKILGTVIGAKITDAHPSVKRYGGLGLVAQGGVAVGLSIMASQHLAGIMVDQNLALGDVIIFGVAATTVIAQLIGPPAVKLAIKLSAEAGRNITREDVIDSWTVADVMNHDVIVIKENEPLVKAGQIFMEHDYLVYPVVDRLNNLIGVLSLEGLKDILTDQDSWTWLLASDVMQPVKSKTFSSSKLKDVIGQIHEYGFTQIPVVEKDNGNKPIGILDIARVQKLIDKEVFRRQKPIKRGNSLCVDSEEMAR